MKVLITSGGTTVKIDPVRYLSNFSSGRFGTNLANEFLRHSHEIMYFVSKNAKSPSKFTVDFKDPNSITEAQQRSDFFNSVSNNYQERQYQFFEEYREGLKKCIAEFNPDAILLAAAVSDYICEPASKKIDSNSNLRIELSPSAKVISEIRSWGFQGKLIGFKLLYDATDEELIAKSQKVIRESKCNAVICNDLKSIQSGNHRIGIVDKTCEMWMNVDIEQKIVKFVESLN